MLTVRKVSVWNGKKYAPAYKAQFGEISVTDRVPAVAKEKALAAAESAVTGTYQPKLISAGGESVLVWRTLDGWFYGFLSSINSSGSFRSIYIGGLGSCEECERKARSHLAQNLYTYDGPDYSNVITDETDRDNYRQWTVQQRQMRQYMADGLTVEQAHKKTLGY